MGSEKGKGKGLGFVDTYEVDGKSYDIYVRKSGSFWCQYDDTATVEKPTLKGVQDRLREIRRKETKTKPVAATYIQAPGYHSETRRDTLVDLMLTGVHAANNNVLVKHQDGRSEQIHCYKNTGSFLRRVTEEERGRYVALQTAVEKAEAALEEWVQERRIDPRKVLAAQEEGED